VSASFTCSKSDQELKKKGRRKRDRYILKQKNRGQRPFYVKINFIRSPRYYWSAGASIDSSENYL
jgi:hypothetical protein